MSGESVFGYFLNTNLVVQVVIAILLIASVMSWTVILQKWMGLSRAGILTRKFEKRFWRAKNLTEIYEDVSEEPANNEGLAALFYAGYQAYDELQAKSHVTSAMVSENVQRALRATLCYEEEALSNRLSLLATVGSVSPYIGLFGTVWGIMMSFQSLGAASQVTIAMVAPGISSALIATAVGLFAAIPAVIFYNKYATRVEQLMNRYEAFAEQFISLVQYRTLPESVTKSMGEKVHA